MPAANTDKLRKKKSLFQTTLNGGINDSDTSLTLNSASGLPTDTAVTIVINRVDANGTASPTLMEVVTGTVSGSTVSNLLRAKDGTTAKSHLNGAVVEMVWDAQTWNDFVDAYLVEHDQDGGHKFFSPASDSGQAEMYFAEDTENGTNKITLKGPATLASDKTLTLPDADDELVGKAATQILTSKTLSAGVALDGSADENISLFGLARQALMNANFDIWQRNTTFTPNDDVFTADRWNFLTETNAAWTISRDTDVPSTKATYALKAVKQATGANAQMAIVQFLENVDTKKLAGQIVSLSFKAKTQSSQIAKLRATVLAWSGTADSLTSDVIGTWAQDGTDPTFAANWTKEKDGSDLSLSDSYQTFKIENIALDTIGTNNLALVIWVDDGTIATGDTFWISQVQLNIGSVALPFQPKSFEEELRACQRYYEKSFDYGTAPADNAGTSGALSMVASAANAYSGLGTVCYSVKKRISIIPTLYNPSTSSANKIYSSIDGAKPASVTCEGMNGFGVYINNSAPTLNATLKVNWTADAEL